MALAGAKLWKESATLILLARNSKAQVKTDKFDYKVHITTQFILFFIFLSHKFILRFWF